VFGACIILLGTGLQGGAQNSMFDDLVQVWKIES
jgi:hypothetical protein